MAMILLRVFILLFCWCVGQLISSLGLCGFMHFCHLLNWVAVLYVASSPSGINSRRSGKVSRVSEPAGIVGFYLFGSVPEPYTLYQDIRSVPAGSAIWVKAVGPGEPRPYFRPASIWAEAEEHGEQGPDLDVPKAKQVFFLDRLPKHGVAEGLGRLGHGYPLDRRAVAACGESILGCGRAAGPGVQSLGASFPLIAEISSRRIRWDWIRSR